MTKRQKDRHTEMTSNGLRCTQTARKPVGQKNKTKKDRKKPAGQVLEARVIGKIDLFKLFLHAESFIFLIDGVFGPS